MKLKKIKHRLWLRRSIDLNLYKPTGTYQADWLNVSGEKYTCPADIALNFVNTNIWIGSSECQNMHC